MSGNSRRYRWPRSTRSVSSPRCTAHDPRNGTTPRVNSSIMKHTLPGTPDNSRPRRELDEADVFNARGCRCRRVHDAVGSSESGEPRLALVYLYRKRAAEVDTSFVIGARNVCQPARVLVGSH